MMMSKPILTYEPFSIVVVPFPFTDRNQVKRRPAIVLSEQDFQEETEHVTLLMVTSAKHSSWESDHKIVDLVSAGLDAASIIRQKIFTIDTQLILAQKGKLGLEDERIIKKLLKKHLLCIL